MCVCVCVESELTYQYWIVFEEKCDLSESLGLVLVYFWQGTDLLGPPSNQHRHLNTSKKSKKKNVLSVGNHHSTAHELHFGKITDYEEKSTANFEFGLLSRSLPHSLSEAQIGKLIYNRYTIWYIWVIRRTIRRRQQFIASLVRDERPRHSQSIRWGPQQAQLVVSHTAKSTQVPSRVSNPIVGCIPDRKYPHRFTFSLAYYQSSSSYVVFISLYFTPDTVLTKLTKMADTEIIVTNAGEPSTKASLIVVSNRLPFVLTRNAKTKELERKARWVDKIHFYCKIKTPKKRITEIHKYCTINSFIFSNTSWVNCRLKK